jgi:hypothetical protein
MRTKKNALKAIQDSNVYTLARRSRAHQLDTLGQKKLTAALSQTSSPYGWLYTSCCRITGCNKNGWRIAIGRRQKLHSTKLSRRVKSKIHKTQVDAENDMFNFRKSRESKGAMLDLDKWEQTVLNGAEALVCAGVDDGSSNVSFVRKTY